MKGYYKFYPGEGAMYCPWMEHWYFSAKPYSLWQSLVFVLFGRYA